MSYCRRRYQRRGDQTNCVKREMTGTRSKFKIDIYKLATKNIKDIIIVFDGSRRKTILKMRN